MISVENFMKIEESINSMITLLDDEIYGCKPKTNELSRDEYLWFEELEKVSTKLNELKEEMIFTLEIKEAEE